MELSLSIRHDLAQTLINKLHIYDWYFIKESFYDEIDVYSHITSFEGSFRLVLQELIFRKILNEDFY